MGMTTRRQFIEGAIATAAGVAMLAPGIAAARQPAAQAASRLRLGRVVFDERFAAARDFGDEAHKRSIPTRAIHGGVHDLWYDDLYYRWRDQRAPTAGMTDARTLFLLEMMASDARMRVVHRIHHIDTGGALAHHIFGPLQQRGEWAARMSGGRADWARRAAGIVLAWPGSQPHTGNAGSDILAARGQALDGQTLVSWIIC
jgi:hypothetical protein